MDEQLTKSFQQYSIINRNARSISKSIDALQESFKCCGLDGPKWWAINVAEFRDENVPLSCCQEVTADSDPGRCPANQSRFTKGCDQELRDILSLCIAFIVAFLIIVGITLLIAACFACVLAAAINSN